jgi:hypothetical protein
MMGDRQKFDEVVRISKEWTPQENHDHEAHFRNELLEYLNERLNESQSGGLGLGQSQKDVVERESGGDNVDISVNDAIAIEMKRDFTNSQAKKLRGQIESYLRNYNYLIVCACGVKQTDQWHKLEKEYGGQQGFGMNNSEIVFIRKEKENFGGSHGGQDGGLDDMLF